MIWITQTAMRGKKVREMLFIETGAPDLFKALSEFAGIVQSPSKDATNKFIGNKYASIGEVLAVCRPALAKCGLAVFQSLSVDGDDIVIETLVTHSSGQWIQAEPLKARPVRAPRGAAPVTISAQEATTQEKTAAYTYLRRYAYLAALCLAAEDDMDGEPERREPTREERREPEREKRESTHHMNADVESAVRALAGCANDGGLTAVAAELLKKHGPVASTAPWIAFQERCKALGASPRAIVDRALDYRREDEATGAA